MIDIGDNGITQDWLDTFAESERKGENLAASFFWRIALDVLPLGVNPDHPKVKEAIAKIRQSVERRNAELGR